MGWMWRACWPTQQCANLSIGWRTRLPISPRPRRRSNADQSVPSACEFNAYSGDPIHPLKAGIHPASVSGGNSRWPLFADCAIVPGNVVLFYPYHRCTRTHLRKCCCNSGDKRICDVRQHGSSTTELAITRSCRMACPLPRGRSRDVCDPSNWLGS